MIIVNAVILFIFFIIYLISLKTAGAWLRDIDKKEHKLYFLYPMAEFLLRKFRLYRYTLRNTRITDSIRALYVINSEERQKLYWCSKTALIILITAIFCTLSIIGELSADNSSILLDGRYLIRPGYGEGSREVVLNAALERNAEQSGKEKNTSDISSNYTINVEPREYTEEELTRLFEEAKQYLLEVVLGDNTSFEYIEKNLYFCDTIPETGISVEWRPEDYALIKSDGTICNEELTEAASTQVNAVLRYLEDSIQLQFSFLIIPKQYNTEESLRQQLENNIGEAAKASVKKEWIELPDTLGSYRIHWSESKDSPGMLFLLIGSITAIMVWKLRDNELKNQMKKRKNQLLLDYPEIINKFTLLINSGMTVKQAWSKIAEDYERKLQKSSRNAKQAKREENKIHYAYEEMLISVNELKLGLSEGKVFEQYGRRIGLLPYIRFTNLITQNLKKGNKGLTEQLQQEAAEAFEARKETAKRLGEEAGTKLIIPMMILLILVLMIILIPAFISFQMPYSAS